MRRLCPTCGKPVPEGQPCPRCSKAPRGRRPSHGTRTRAQEAARKTANPWRSQYSSTAYQRARQAALASTNGRCAMCGAPIAQSSNGRWVVRRGAGGVHHVRALSQGGGNGLSNLVPLCSACHNRVDAERRRNEGS